MEKEIFNLIASQGAFAALFTWMLFDTRRDSKERELKYQQIINGLVNKIGEIQEIKEDVRKIKLTLNTK